MNLEKSVYTALWGSESWEISAHPSDPSVIADGEENLMVGRESEKKELLKAYSSEFSEFVAVYGRGSRCMSPM